MVMFIYENQILLGSSDHQGVAILDGFGEFYSPPLNVKSRAADLANSYFRGITQVEHAGSLTMYIQKPDQRVKLMTEIFRAIVSDSEMPNTPSNAKWYSLEDLQSAEGLREDGRYIYSRGIRGESLSVTLDVSQLGLWVDAKLLAVEE